MHHEVAEAPGLLEVDDALLVELEHREEPHDDLELLVVSDVRSRKRTAPRRRQQREHRLDRVAHAGADRRDVIGADLGLRLGNSPDRAAARNASSETRSSGSGASERNGSSGPALRASERPASAMCAWSTFAASWNVLQSSRRASRRSRSSNRDSSSSSSMSSRPGQQPAGLQLHERGRDEQELGRRLEIDPLHALDLGAERVDDARERDLPEVDLLLEDQMQQEIERALEDRCRDLVGHGASAVSNGVGEYCRTAVRTGPQHQVHRGSTPVVCAVVTRVFSGIKPTGEMHLGNYVGAVRRWVDDQPPAGSAAARATTTPSSASSTSTR